MACPDFPPVSESAPGGCPRSGNPAGSVLKHLICFMDPMKKCVSFVIWPDRTPNSLNRWESPSSPSLPQPARITKGSKSTSDPQGCFHSRPVRRLQPTAEIYPRSQQLHRLRPTTEIFPEKPRRMLSKRPAKICPRPQQLRLLQPTTEIFPEKPRRMLSRGHSDKTAM